MRAPRPTGPRRPSRWTLTALAIAATLAVPPLAVVSSLTQPAQGVWAHLWRTQLVELTLNTLALLAGVGLGTFVLGTALGWLITSYEFLGRRVFEWALVLPLALPAYVIGFAVSGSSTTRGRCSRPCAAIWDPARCYPTRAPTGASCW